MEIAQLRIVNNITKEELASLLADSNQSIEVVFQDDEGKQLVYDIAPDLRNEEPIAESFKKVFDFADYQINKNEIRVTIVSEGNKFKLSASKLIGVEENTEVVESHEVNIRVTINTGNVSGQILLDKTFSIDIANEITKEEKKEFKDLELTLSGEKWSEFTVKGKSKISFEKSATETVLIGNKLEGFYTE